MRQRAVSVEEVKNKLRELKGRNLSVAVNRGRNKITRMNGVIVDMFPSVFTIRVVAGDILSFSFSDIICGEVRLKSISN